MAGLNCPNRLMINKALATFKEAPDQMRQDLHMIKTMHSMIEGNDMNLGGRLDYVKPTGDLDEMLMKSTGKNLDDFSKGNVDDDQKLVLQLHKFKLMDTLIALKKNPKELKRMMMNTTGTNITKANIKASVFEYSKEFHWRSANDKIHNVFDKIFGFFALASLTKNESVTGNVNTTYDKHPFSRSVYNKSYTLDNMTEVLYYNASKQWNDILQKTKGFKFIDHEIINEIMPLATHKHVEKESSGPNQPIKYIAVMEKLLSKFNNDQTKADNAFSEFMDFNVAFNKFNYGIDIRTHKIWFDKNTSKYMLYTISKDNANPMKVEYDINNFKDSWVYNVQMLGRQAREAIGKPGDRTLSPVEQQIIDKFSEDGPFKFNMKLGYVPMFKDDDGATAGGMNAVDVYNSIPTLGFLKQRNEERSKHLKPINIFEDMNDELATTKLVFSELSMFTLMNNTREMLKADYVDKLNFTDHQKAVLTENVVSLNEHFSKPNKPEGMLKYAISASHMLSTMYGSFILNKPSSAINNYIGGKLVALTNSIGLPGMDYVSVSSNWRNAKKEKDNIIRDTIDSIIDKAIAPFSRQESSIQTTESIEDFRGKAQAATQYIADKVADYSMFAAPAMVLDAFGINLSEKVEMTSSTFTSQRKSEKALRADYYKGLAYSIVKAKIAAYKEEPSKMTTTRLIELTEKALKESQDDIAYFERRIHGDFSKTSKSAKAMLSVSDAKTIPEVLLGTMLISQVQMKAPMVFGAASMFNNLYSTTMAMNESGDLNKVTADAVKMMGIPLGLAAADYLGRLGVAPELTTINSVDPASIYLDGAEVATWLSSVFLGAEIPELQGSTIMKKVARLGAGVMASGSIGSMMDKIATGEEVVPSILSKFNLNPIDALYGIKEKMSIGDEIYDPKTGTTKIASRSGDVVKAGTEKISDIPLFGFIINKATDRSATISHILKQITSGDQKQSLRNMSGWFQKEFGLNLSYNEMWYGMQLNENNFLNVQTDPNELSQEYVTRFKNMTLGE